MQRLASSHQGLVVARHCPETTFLTCPSFYIVCWGAPLLGYLSSGSQPRTHGCWCAYEAPQPLVLLSPPNLPMPAVLHPPPCLAPELPDPPAAYAHLLLQDVEASMPLAPCTPARSKKLLEEHECQPLRAEDTRSLRLHFSACRSFYMNNDLQRR